MKTFICVLLLTFASSIYCKTLQNLQAPKKCEDVLAQDLCDDLRKMAAAFKLHASRVDDAILDAVAKGLVQAPGIMISAVSFIKNDVLTKTCEDLLAPRMCTKLRVIGAELKIKADIVDAFVKDAIAKGMDKGEEIYSTVLDFYKAEVKDKTCEDFLAPDVCVQLRKTAGNLKVKYDKVEEAVVSAIIQGYQNRQEIYEDVLDFFRDEVLSKTCEDFLAGNLCTVLRTTAATLKIKAEKVDRAVKEALIKGIVTANEVYDFVVEFYKTEVKTKKCEDFLPTDVCDQVKKAAAAFKVEADKVDEVVKSALAKGLSTATEIVNSAVAELKELITCEDWLPSWTCSLARSIARAAGVKAREVNQAVKEAVAKGIQDAKALYQSIKDYINKQTLA